MMDYSDQLLFDIVNTEPARPGTADEICKQVYQRLFQRQRGGAVKAQQRWL